MKTKEKERKERRGKKKKKERKGNFYSILFPRLILSLLRLLFFVFQHSNLNLYSVLIIRAALTLFSLLVLSDKSADIRGLISQTCQGGAIWRKIIILRYFLARCLGSTRRFFGMNSKISKNKQRQKHSAQRCIKYSFLICNHLLITVV